MRRFLPGILGALLLVVPASGGVVTKRFDWAPQKGVQVLDWTENGITVKQITFDMGTVVKPTRLSTARAHVRVDNDSPTDVVPGIALAIFDEENHLIAAGEGGVKVGDLNKGSRDDFTVTFSHVFRNLDRAKYFYLSVETKR
ncbi:MAG TPA: hypothetical protein VFL12_13720 [Thermoanaerobaculia bacterium]|nr:hypothetical protein [Thermoanaerobaculia bacterium]